MSKKKLDVIELNKKEERIVLEEKQSPLLSFWHSYYLLLFITAAILSLTILILGIYVNLRNVTPSEEEVIKEVSIDTTLDNYEAKITTTLTEETAKDIFLKKGAFKKKGEVILVKKIDNDDFTIKYYSDGTAIRVAKNIGTITRIKSLTNGDYGITDDGVINIKAITSDVSIKETKNYDWGTITYYSDGSADISNSDIDIFVRDSSDINKDYISDNKVTYYKNTKKVGDIILNYYHDGTIEVIKNKKNYLVRNEDDLKITSNDVTFPNDNAAEIYKTKKLADGKTIDYYQDGGAIIRDNDKTISVRKSNSIVIKNNKIYEIVDNTYVEISNTRDNVTYYTNGGAVINDEETDYYVSENSFIKYQDDKIKDIPSISETLSKETNNDKENVKVFEHTAVITTDEYINIVPREKINFTTSGEVKEVKIEYDEDINEFKIINNTNEKITYRVIINESPKTDLDTEYMRFQLSAGKDYVTPQKLKDHLWKDDALASTLKLTGKNYILYEGEIEPHDSNYFNIMFWTDYDTIPNSMQDKYFYGTIKIYAWSTIQ